MKRTDAVCKRTPREAVDREDASIAADVAVAVTAAAADGVTESGAYEIGKGTPSGLMAEDAPERDARGGCRPNSAS